MPTPPPKSPALVAVEKAGKKLARINAQRDTAIGELRVALRAADAEGGHTRSDLVAAAGVARQTVYDALRDPTPNAVVTAGLVAEARASTALDRDQTHVIGPSHPTPDAAGGHGASEGDPTL